MKSGEDLNYLAKMLILDGNGEDLTHLVEMSILDEEIVAKIKKLGYKPTFYKNGVEFKNGKPAKPFFEYREELGSYVSGIRENGQEKNVKNAIYYEVVDNLFKLAEADRHY